MKSKAETLSYIEFKERFLQYGGFLFEDSFSYPGFSFVDHYFEETSEFCVFSDFLNPLLTKSKIFETIQNIENETKNGKFVCSAFYYELGTYLFEKLESNLNLIPHQTKLINGKVFQKKISYLYKNPTQTELLEAKVISLKPHWSKETYLQKFNLAKEYLINGESYELNLCFLNEIKTEGDPFELYQLLKKKQKTKYSAYLPFQDSTIVSLSPELFFETFGDQIFTEPMKGTVTRGVSFEEDQRKKWQLSGSEKNKSENVMITDLFRNDLGRISEIGSVKTEELFSTVPLDTVWQMVSRITSKLRKNLSFAEMFISLFPSGSVTGAPKLRSMEILRLLEEKNRGIYTGSLFRSESSESITIFKANIAIRTMELSFENSEKIWKGTYGIGSAVTVLSSGEDEYEECLSKRNFLINQTPPSFALLETIKYYKDRFRFLKFHLERMEKSAMRFGYPFEKKVVLDHLNKIKTLEDNQSGAKRIRLLLEETGEIKLEVFDLVLNPKSKEINLWVSPLPIPKQDLFLVHKTTYRPFYDKAFFDAKKNGGDDAIFLDEDGFIQETCIRNLFFLIHGEWITPPLTYTGLKGTFRSALLKKGWIKEKEIHISELKEVQSILTGNSLRGLERAKVLI